MKTLSNTWDPAHLQELHEQHFQNSAAWMKAWSGSHLQSFLQEGLPTRKQENWKYTPLVALQSQELQLTQKINEQIILSHNFLSDSYRLVFVNGYFNEALSSLQQLSPYLHDCGGELSEELLHHFVAPHQNSFSALNAGLLTDTLLIRIKANVKLEKPIHIIHLATPAFSNQMAHPRSIIIAGEGSEFTLFEEYTSMSDNVYFNNTVTYLELQSHARVNYYKLQNESSNAFHIANFHVFQEKNSEINCYHFANGAQLSREDITTSFQAEGSCAKLIGFYQANNKQLLDYHTRIDHFSSHCKSEQFYKGIFDGQSKGVFNGKVVVHPDAQKTQARQFNRNLLLSSLAQVDTKPELEIHADDIQCSHGVTVSELEEEALFYLRARGIALEDARKLLMTAFVEEIFDRLPNVAIKNYIREQCNKASIEAL